MKEATLERNTKETKIRASLAVGVENGGLCGKSGIGFFDHMLNSFCVHGGFRLTLEVTGDLEVDGHHTVEDCGIVIGRLFADILGDKSGIRRFGNRYIPMDESLAFCALDLSGRPFLVFDADFTSPMIGDYDSQLTVEFFRALAFQMGATLHLKLMYGDNDHHKTEALYKAAAHAIREAMEPTANGQILSAKGTLA
ncbi:MAG: imidazoleglycerol-phosphate dehydratase HisB [Ruminococcaceae bacterium]|nr:imidazoleglycerol-phosphate dehydratase HisB [Oscillospiraceae bacterium]